MTTLQSCHFGTWAFSMWQKHWHYHLFILILKILVISGNFSVFIIKQVYLASLKLHEQPKWQVAGTQVCQGLAITQPLYDTIESNNNEAMTLLLLKNHKQNCDSFKTTFSFQPLLDLLHNLGPNLGQLLHGPIHVLHKLLPQLIPLDCTTIGEWWNVRNFV